MSSEEDLVRRFSLDGLVFRAADYAVFIVLLCIAGGLGVYSGIIEIRNKKKLGEGGGKEAAMGSRDLGVIPVSFSLMASLVASPFVLGTPAETYAFGTTFAYLAIGYAIGMFICTHFFIKVFYVMGITSVYEYIERRFSLSLRRITTLIFASSMLIYMGIIVYSPAIALTQVTGINVEMAVVVVGVVGTVYTSIGGLKGVIWVDVMQMLVLISGFIAIVVKGTQEAGGPSAIVDNANEGGRFVFDNLNIHPHERTSVWTQIIGGAFVGVNIFANQAIAQKLLTLPTVNKMYQTIFTTMIVYTVFLWTFVASGIVMYGYYHGCDPLMLGEFRADQFIMVFTMRIFDNMPGVPGLVVAAVFASSLSSVAAGINALAAVTILDLINPLYKRYRGKDIMAFRPALSMTIFKSLAVLYGLLTIGVAFLAQVLGSSLLQLAFSLLGIVGGPMLSVFFMGIFMPWMNNLGATVGCLVSLVLTFWVAVGNVFTGAGERTYEPLPLTRAECPTNLSSIPIPIPPEQPTSFGALEDFYRMSYMWYTLFAMICSLISASIVSIMTGNNRKKQIDMSLVHPWFSRKTTAQDKKTKKADHEAAATPSPHPAENGLPPGYMHYVPPEGGYDNPAFLTFVPYSPQDITTHF